MMVHTTSTPRLRATAMTVLRVPKSTPTTVAGQVSISRSSAAGWRLWTYHSYWRINVVQVCDSKVKKRSQRIVKSVTRWRDGEKVFVVFVVRKLFWSWFQVVGRKNITAQNKPPRLAFPQPSIHAWTFESLLPATTTYQISSFTNRPLPLSLLWTAVHYSSYVSHSMYGKSVFGFSCWKSCD